MIMDSLWKANRVLSSLLGRLDDKRGDSKLMKYKNWIAMVEKKTSSLYSVHKALELLDGENKKEKANGYYMKLSSLLTEIISLMAITTFKQDSISLTSPGTPQHMNPEYIRYMLLDLWNYIVASLSNRSLNIEGDALSLSHDTILSILRRNEFDVDYLLKYDPIATRYREHLLSTLNLSVSRISEPGTFLFFASRVLAVLYWRIPALSEIIHSSVCVSNPLVEGVITSSPELRSKKVVNTTFNNNDNSNSTPNNNNENANNDDTNNNNNNNHNEEDDGGVIPLDDINFHDDINCNDNNPNICTNTPNNNTNNNNNSTGDSFSSRLNALLAWKSFAVDLPPSPTPWIDLLAKRELAFVLFFKEWILYVKNELNPSAVEWYQVPGFKPLLYSILHDIRTKDQPPPPLTKPYPLLELQFLLLEVTDGHLVDAYVKGAFLRTNVYDIPVVFNTLNLIEGWFAELAHIDLILPPSFDIDFYCRGLGILLASDHHQVVIRVIQIIYTYADLVDDTFRFALFGDLLIKKYFFTLFLHWDPGVRNAYHQLLIFRMVRVKRSVLSKDGFIVRELARLNASSSATPSPSSSFLSSISTAFSLFTTDTSTSTTPTTTPRGSTTLTKNQIQQQQQQQQQQPAIMSVDAHLFLQLDSYVKLVEDQLRMRMKGVKITQPHYPPSLEVYAPSALAEFTQHLSRYHQWELRNEPPPRLTPLPFIRSGMGDF